MQKSYTYFKFFFNIKPLKYELPDIYQSKQNILIS